MIKRLEIKEKRVYATGRGQWVVLSRFKIRKSKKEDTITF